MKTQEAETLAPGLRRLVAPNPSPMTGAGTNTYIVGDRRVAVIDPGPDLPGQTERILGALPAGAAVTHILVTHAHLDHSAAAPALSRATGAPVLAFGDARSGRSARMRDIDDPGGGEGLDLGFSPDLTLQDGAEIGGEEWTLTTLHTPGHLGGHLCFAMGSTVFSGDHAMGWSTSIVSPPDGDMTDYIASLHRLANLAPRRLLPGHGETVEDAPARLDWLIRHRRDREAAILTALRAGPASPQEIARHIYTETPSALLPAAARNVLAHLIDLEARNLAIRSTPPGTAPRFAPL